MQSLEYFSYFWAIYLKRTWRNWNRFIGQLLRKVRKLGLKFYVKELGLFGVQNKRGTDVIAVYTFLKVM